MQAFDTITIISTSDPAPILNEPLTMQFTPATPSIASAFAYTQESEYYPGVRVPPSCSFSIGLQPFTFEDIHGRKVYYRAALESATELPDWLVFDNETVTFDGVTQPGQEPVVYRVSIFGSDHYGYSDIEQTFSIVVSGSNVQIPREGLMLNITAGYPLRNVSWQDIGGLGIADRAVGTADIAHIKVNTSTYDWLSFDETDGMFGGTAPAMLIGKDLDSDILVTVIDRYNETITASLSLNIEPYAFTSDSFPSAAVELNGTVRVSINKYIIGGMKPVINVSAEPATESSWIGYDPVSRNLTGIAPSQIEGKIVALSLEARDPVTNGKSWASLMLNATRQVAPLVAVNSGPRGISRHAIIALATVAASVGVLVILVAISCLIHRRHTGTERRERIASEPVFGDKGESWQDSNIGRVEEAGVQKATRHDYEVIHRHKPSSSYSADTVRQLISYPMMLRPQSLQKGPPRPAPLPPAGCGQLIAGLSVIQETCEGTTHNSPSSVSTPASDFVNDNADLGDSLVSFYTGHTPETLHASRAARRNTPLPFDDRSSLRTGGSSSEDGERYADHPGSLDDHERVPAPATWGEMTQIYGVSFPDHGADRFVVSASGKRIVSYGTGIKSARCGSSFSEDSAVATYQTKLQTALPSRFGRSISSRPSSSRKHRGQIDGLTEPLPPRSTKDTTHDVL